MVILAGLAGLALGWLVYWVADGLPRWSGHETPRRARTSPLAAGSLAAGLFGAVFFAGLWLAYDATAEFALYAANFLFFLLIAIIDLEHRLILNVMVYPAILLALGIQWVAGSQDMLRVVLGGGMAFSIFFLTAWLKPGQLGGGDVKLAALIGFALGFPAVLWALIVGTGAAGVVAVWLLSSHRGGLKTQLPYAPFLCFGAMVALLYTPAFMMA